MAHSVTRVTGDRSVHTGIPCSDLDTDAPRTFHSISLERHLPARASCLGIPTLCNCGERGEVADHQVAVECLPGAALTADDDRLVDDRPLPRCRLSFVISFDNARSRRPGPRAAWLSWRAVCVCSHSDNNSSADSCHAADENEEATEEKR